MASPPTVLVAEDEPDVLELYSTWLSEEYDVRTARDGSEALEQLDPDVDAILLDRKMPTSGDEVLRVIEEQEETYPVGMVTAVDPDFDIIDMGFDAYEIKPVSKSKLLSLVTELLKIKEYNSVIERYHRLATKKATLEANKQRLELQESEEYNRLVAELNRVQEKADQTINQMDEDKQSPMLFNF